MESFRKFVDAHNMKIDYFYDDDHHEYDDACNLISKELLRLLKEDPKLGREYINLGLCLQWEDAEEAIRYYISYIISEREKGSINMVEEKDDRWKICQSWLHTAFTYNRKILQLHDIYMIFAMKNGYNNIIEEETRRGWDGLKILDINNLYKIDNNNFLFYVTNGGNINN